jgi:hypothetical protein
VALNEAVRVISQTLFETKKLFAPAFGRFRINQTLPAIMQAQNSYKMKLETKIRNLITETNATSETRFDVVAHELWGNSREGFSTNSSWYIATNADISQVLTSARGRWEVFKLNYLPKARVGDITDSGYDSTLCLEVDYVPFLEIRLS